MDVARVEATELITFARKANEYHREVESHVGAALDSARLAGGALNDAQVQIQTREGWKRGDGSWTAWLDENFEGAERTAQMYMQIAEGWQIVEGARRTGVRLESIYEARKLIAAHNATEQLPPEVKDEVWTRAEKKSGGKPSAATVKTAYEETSKKKVNDFLEKEEQQAIEDAREENPRLVAEYLDAVKTFGRKHREYMKLLKPEDFSPEALRFIKHKLTTITGDFDNV